MPRIRSYSDEDFINAVKSSFSLRSVLSKLNLKPSGGNYSVAKRRILLLGLDISHFTGKGHLKGKHHTWAKKTPLDEILVKDSRYGGGSSQLKKRLFDAGLLHKICYNCGLTKWMGKPIPLELEHINGDRFDNRLFNLSILCPNCHAFTETYRGRNKKST